MNDAVAGHVISLELIEVETQAAVTLSGEKVFAYITDAPDIPMIDGLFEEWTDPHTDNTRDVNNPDVDITAYDSISLSDSSVTDWGGTFNYLDSNPDGDNPPQSKWDITRVWFANDASYYYVRWDIAVAKIARVKSTAYAVWVDIDGFAPITEDVFMWIEFTSKGVGTITVKDSSDVDLWTGTTSNFQLVDIGTKVAVEAAFERSATTGLDSSNVIGAVHSHPSASFKSNIKDYVPDSTETYSYFYFEMATPTTDSTGHQADVNGLPEYHTIILPISGVMALFVIARKRK